MMYIAHEIPFIMSDQVTGQLVQMCTKLIRHSKTFFRNSVYLKHYSKSGTLCDYISLQSLYFESVNRLLIFQDHCCQQLSGQSSEFVLNGPLTRSGNVLILLFVFPCLFALLNTQSLF